MMKSKLRRLKVTSVMLALMILASSVFCSASQSSNAALDAAEQNVREKWAAMYKEITTEFATMDSNEISSDTADGAAGRVYRNTTAVPPNDYMEYLGENYVAVNKNSGRGMWPSFYNLMNSKILNFHSYIKDYSDIRFYVYIGNISSGGELKLNFKYSDNTSVLITKNINSEMKDQYILFDVLSDLELTSISQLLNLKGENVTLNSVILEGEASFASEGMFLGAFIGLTKSNAQIPEDCNTPGELLYAAKEFDVSGYKNSAEFLEAVEQLSIIYNSEAIKMGISELKASWLAMEKVEYAELGTLIGNDLTPINTGGDSSVGRITEDNSGIMPEVDISSLGQNIIKVNKETARGIWPSFYNLNGTKISNASELFKGYDDIKLSFYTGDVQIDGNLQLIIKTTSDKKIILNKNIKITDSAKIMSFSLLSDGNYENISDALETGELTEICLESDNNSGGSLKAYRMVIGSLMGCKITKPQIPDNLNEQSSVTEWLLAAQDFNTDGYSGVTDFNKAIDNLVSIIAPSGQYCHEEINALKTAWSELESAAEPKAVEWRAIKGATPGGAISPIEMPTFSAEDSIKLGNYAAAFDIDDVGTGTGNAWLINCPVVAGALSLDNYSDIYQWIYSGEITSPGEKVKIIWDFKNASGTSKYVLTEEFVMESNTWYCLRLSDYYSSMNDFIDQFGSETVSAVTYNIYNKPFTANGLVLGTFMAVEKQTLNVPKDLNESSSAAEWLYCAESVDINSCKNTEKFRIALNALRDAINENYDLIKNDLIRRIKTLWIDNVEIKNATRIAGVTEVEVKEGYTLAGTSVRNNPKDFNGLPVGTDCQVLGNYYAKATFPSLRYFLFRNTEENGDRFNVSLNGYDCLYFYIYAENVTADGALSSVLLNNSWEFLGEPQINITKDKSDRWLRVMLTSEKIEEMFSGDYDDVLASVQIYNTDGTIQADAIYISDLFIGNKSQVTRPGTLGNSNNAEEWVAAAEKIPEYNKTFEFDLAVSALKAFFTEKGKSLAQLKRSFEKISLDSVPSGIMPTDAGSLIRSAKAFDTSEFTDLNLVNNFKTALLKAQELYSINILVNINGNGTVNGDGIYYEGEVAEVSAVNAENSEFGGWFENGAIIEYGLPTYKFLVESDRNIELLFFKKLEFTDKGSGITAKINRLDSKDNYTDVVGFHVTEYTPSSLEKMFIEEYGFELVSSYQINFTDAQNKIIKDIGGRSVTISYQIPSGIKAGITNLAVAANEVRLCNSNYYSDKHIYTFNFNTNTFLLLKLK